MGEGALKAARAFAQLIESNIEQAVPLGLTLIFWILLSLAPELSPVQGPHGGFSATKTNNDLSFRQLILPRLSPSLELGNPV